MAKFWFGCGALIIAARVIYWGWTGSHSLSLRLTVCVFICGLLGAITFEAFRSINHKRGLWIESHPEARQLTKHDRPQVTVTDGERELAKLLGGYRGQAKVNDTKERSGRVRRVRVPYPEEVEALMTKGKTLARSGRWREAAGAYQSAIDLVSASGGDTNAVAGEALYEVLPAMNKEEERGQV
jgi:hypothetical protein